MTARRDDEPEARPRPRGAVGSDGAEATPSPPPPPPRSSRSPARLEGAAAGQAVAATGNTIVTVARVGRLLGRTGWRIARQLPGADLVEQQAQRLRQVAEAELRRALDVQQNLFGATSAEEERVMTLVQDAGSDPEPLRTAMGELLERAAEPDGGPGRNYLFGSIISQLVPDEARILAALAGATPFAVVDVVAKVGRTGRRTRSVLTHVSTVAPAAGVSRPQNGAAYLARLEGFGLLEYIAPTADLDAQFDALAADPEVVSARAAADRRKPSNSRLVRRALTLSALGREFWAASAPVRAPDRGVIARTAD